MLKYKIVLAGDKNVGKSSLIARFVDGIFLSASMDTIGVAFKRKKLSLDEKKTLDLTIWDFGGEEKYRTLFPQYVHGAVGALILFDMTRKETLDGVEKWLEIIDNNADEDLIKVLIPTKIDLKDDNQVDIKDAFKFAKKFNFYGDPIATSSKTGENVEKAFRKVAEGITNIRLQRCTNCGELFSKKLKFCNYCGEAVEINVITS